MLLIFLPYDVNIEFKMALIPHDKTTPILQDN